MVRPHVIQRRLAALFSVDDVQGYSRLMAEDEVQSWQRMPWNVEAGWWYAFTGS